VKYNILKALEYNGIESKHDYGWKIHILYSYAYTDLMDGWPMVDWVRDTVEKATGFQGVGIDICLWN